MTYTCALGFLDLGHVRDLIDLTYFYYLQLTKHGRWRANDILATNVPDGKVVLKLDVPQPLRLALARNLAYDESIFHELETYWCFFPGYHHSSFSPEDLVSNLLGTWIAELAITALETAPPTLEGTFDVEVRTALESVLGRLGALPRAGTSDAFQIVVDLGWVQGPQTETFLRRRNFNIRPIDPWILPGVTGCPSGSVPAEFRFELPDMAKYYSASYRTNYAWYKRNRLVAIPPNLVVIIPDGLMIPGAPSLITRDQFASETRRVEVEARARYGPDYNHP